VEICRQWSHIVQVVYRWPTSQYNMFIWINFLYGKQIGRKYAGVKTYGFNSVRILNQWTAGYRVVARGNLDMWNGGCPYDNLIWLLYDRDIPCGIAIFRWHYQVSPSALPMLSAQSQVQTDPFLAEWLPWQSIWLFCTSNLTNDGRWKIVHTPLQDEAGSVSLLVSIIKAANGTIKVNYVPKLIFCT